MEAHATQTANTVMALLTIKHAARAMDLEITTPEELAKRMGWSARRVRSLARELGACRILGNRMRLTKEDVEAILEATKPKPLSRAPTVRDIFRERPAVQIPDITYADLVRLREDKKRRKKVEERAGRRRGSTTKP